MFARALLIIASSLSFAAPWVRANDPALEYQVKALCILNSARFVTWPAGTLGAETSPLVIGILGENPFGSALQEVVAGETVQKRKIVVRRVGVEEAAKACHILFIGRSESARVARILQTLNAAGVLTVSEIDGFARNGGMIGLLLEGGSVRFEVNPSAAQRAQLRIDSRLLRLARIVK